MSNLSSKYNYNSTYSGTDMIPAIYAYDSKTEKMVYHTLGTLQSLSYSVHRGTQPVTVLGRYLPKGFTRGGILVAGSLIFTVFDRHSLYEYSRGSSSLNRATPASTLPPFDIIVHLANEQGNESVLVIYGVRIVDEGQVHSIEDVYTENTMSFMAQDINLLEPKGEYLKNNEDWQIREYYNSNSPEFIRNDTNYIISNRELLINDSYNYGAGLYSTQSLYTRFNPKIK